MRFKALFNRGETRQRDLLELGLQPPLLRVATMRDWWAMSREYPEFRKTSTTPLKDFGYLALFHYIRKFRPARILEFGHGFNASLFERFQGEHEMWGVDDYQALHYFPAKEAWEKTYQDLIVRKCGQSRLMRGILGRGRIPELPENYFDLICSVSVLEELRGKEVDAIFRDVHRLLNPNGIMINTHDWCVKEPKRYARFIRAHEENGFDLGRPARNPPKLDCNDLLLENCTTVMLSYYPESGEERAHPGHWTTLLAIAKKA
jgi:hypothetical protein